MRRRSLSIVCLFFALLSGCESSARSNVSSNEVPHEKPLGQGVAVGDVTSRSALVWLRTDDAVTVHVEWQERNQSIRSIPVTTTKDKDFTATVLLDDLKPGTSYR